MTTVRPWREPAWVASCAAAAASAKGLAGDDAEQLARTLEDTFQRVYRAVAFDIDGTLTAPGTTTLRPEMCEIVQELLLRSVFVVLITGRGAATARSAARQIRDDPRLTDPYLRRLFAIVHNGTHLLQTVGHRSDDFLAEATSLEHEDALEWDPLAAASKVRQALAREHIVTVVEPVARPDVSPRSVRTGFRSDADRARAIELLRDLFEPESTSGRRLYVAGGRYEDTFTVDITATHKGVAIESFAGQIGVHPDAVLRIGDEGDLSGNDYLLLASASGFSVGRFSKSPVACFPVVRDGVLLEGDAATRYLLSLVLLYPPISIPAPDAPEALARQRRFESRAEPRARDEVRDLTDRVRRRASILLRRESLAVPDQRFRLTDLFDPLSGGVRIRDTELSALGKDHEAARLFNLQQLLDTLGAEPRARRAMFTDSEVLLRGPDYYYAQVTRKEDRRLRDYARVARAFVGDGESALRRLRDEPPDLLRFKLALGVYDNVRNILLTVLALLANQRLSTRGPALEEEQAVARLVTLLFQHTDQHLDLLLNPGRWWKRAIDDYLRLLPSVDAEISRLSERWPDSGEFPRYREADDLLLNVAAIELGLIELHARAPTNKPLLAIGVADGGNELPIIASRLGRDLGIEVVPGLVLGVSMYRSSLKGDRARRSVHDHAGKAIEEGSVAFILAEEQHLAGAAAILCDDNTTTGKSLEVARDLCVSQAADVIGAILVRWPGFNRYHHMRMADHGTVDHSLLLGFIRGLVARNTFARLVRDGDPKVYEDQDRVFDKSKVRIQRYLRKNGTHAEDT